MANGPFRRRVEEVGDGIYGHVQPNGRRDWSNAGLVTSQGETLLVDTHALRGRTGAKAGFSECSGTMRAARSVT